MRLTGIITGLSILVLIVASEIGGIAYAVMNRTSINDVMPWTLPMMSSADIALDPDRYWKAWGIAAAVVSIAVIGVVALILSPGRSKLHGDARYARRSEIRRQRMLMPSGVILGKIGRGPNAQLIRHDEETHTLLAAPTGAGKGVGVIVPNLLTYGGSVICVDVKGENYDRTAARRARMGDHVYRFSPRWPDGRSHRWNPLDFISTDPADRMGDLRKLATFIFPAASPESESWVKGARNIFIGACLYVLERRQTKTLGEVYRSIFGIGGFRQNLENMATEPGLSDEARRLLSQHAEYAVDQASGYIGSLEPLNLWNDRKIDAATAATDIDLLNLRRTPTSIYLSVAPDEVEELSPLIRLFFQQVFSILHRSEPGEDEPYPVLMVLDEFRAIGKLESILSAITTIRSFGGRFLIVVQGLSNIDELYRRAGRENIVNNCGFQVFYTLSDSASTEYLQKRLGRSTVKQVSRSFGGGRTPMRNYTETGRELESVDEIGRLDQNRSIIVVDAGRPVRGWRIRYFDEERFAQFVEEPPEPPLLSVRTFLPDEGSPPGPGKPKQPPSDGVRTPKQPLPTSDATAAVGEEARASEQAGSSALNGHGRYSLEATRSKLAAIDAAFADRAATSPSWRFEANAHLNSRPVADAAQVHDGINDVIDRRISMASRNPDGDARFETPEARFSRGWLECADVATQHGHHGIAARNRDTAALLASLKGTLATKP